MVHVSGSHILWVLLIIINGNCILVHVNTLKSEIASSWQRITTSAYLYYCTDKKKYSTMRHLVLRKEMGAPNVTPNAGILDRLSFPSPRIFRRISLKFHKNVYQIRSGNENFVEEGNKYAFWITFARPHLILLAFVVSLPIPFIDEAHTKISPEWIRFDLFLLFKSKISVIPSNWSLVAKGVVS